MFQILVTVNDAQSVLEPCRDLGKRKEAFMVDELQWTCFQK